MKVLLVGVNRRVGVSEKSGRPYDICEASYLTLDKPAEKKDDQGRELWRYTTHGFRVQTIPANPALMSSIEQINSVKLCELVIEPIPDFPQKNWVVGFK